ncbi:MAG: cyclase family protein [Candidatus Omnitrophica bacterium]|nr:cyclase family protein [Candidatus Omnitrophota bacterium]
MTKKIYLYNKNSKQKNIILGNTRFKVVNLTEPLKENTEVFPGDPKPKKRVLCSFKKDNCRHNIYTVGDHNYHPHGDAPNHQNRGYQNKGFEYWNLDFNFSRACMIDLSESKNSRKVGGVRFLNKITDKHIFPYLHQIKNSSALILRTGYDVWLELNKKHILKNIPYIDKSAADLIFKFKKLKVVGIDSLTIDKVGTNYVHRKFKDKLIVECLVNLYGIPKKNRNDFCLQTSPIAIVDATGGPILAYAYIPLNKGIKV